MPILTQNDIKEWKTTRTAFHKAEAKIINRIDHIVKVVYKAFGVKDSNSDYFYFYGAEEGEMGTPKISDDPEQEIGYVMECNGIMENDNWCYTDGIPVKFLFMTDHEITEHIKNENDVCRQKAEQKKLKDAARKISKKEIKAAALSKLTPQERKALGVK